MCYLERPESSTSSTGVYGMARSKTKGYAAVPALIGKMCINGRTWSRKMVQSLERNGSRLYPGTLLVNLYAENIIRNAGTRRNRNWN